MIRTLIIAFALSLAVLTQSLADTIGLSLPLTGRAAPIAKQMKAGAETAINGMQKIGRDIELVVVDDACDAKKAADTAKLLGSASVIAGPLCFDTAVALARELNGDADKTPRPVIAFGTRNKLLARVRTHDGLPLYSLAKESTAEAKAFVKYVLPQFGTKPFAIIDDGSLHGRSLSDDIRLLGEQAGFKPALVANFRPLQTTQRTLIRRLVKAGIQGLIIAAAPEDSITIMRDMAAQNQNWQVAIGEQSAHLQYADGASNIKATPLIIMETQPAMENSRVFTALPESMHAAEKLSFLHGFALAEIAAKVARAEYIDLRGKTFKTELGPVKFGADGRAELAPFTLFRWNGEKPVPVESN